ncbi:MAG: DNA repair protein RecO [Anaerovoracaceae bacterium]|jgi:DNA repair protein RecO (recombination protein O)|nr:DNA repair protein RecO [Clostridiales bacterium]
MFTDTEGIVFRQVKTVNGRRIVLLFSKKYGKISAGTNISEKGKNKSSLALRPFTYGRYELYKSRNNFHINSTDVIRSYYRIGENVEKYLYCSYALEFTEKLLPEEAPAPGVFRLILDFFEMMEKRLKKYSTLLLAYKIKVLQESGSMPQIKQCVLCGNKDEAALFSIKEGGILCKKCCSKYPNMENDTLIYKIDFGIVNVLQYIMDSPLRNFENLALDDRIQKKLHTIIKGYIAYHLDIAGLKSEGFLAE